MRITDIPFEAIDWTIVPPVDHIPLCLDGELHTELADGRTFVLTAGMSYHVADAVAPHRSSAPTGARLFIVD